MLGDLRLGVFGGTFDPIHLGHLILAEQARERLRLDEVLFLPAAAPPHKQSREITSGARRLEMVELAIAGNACFSASDLEWRREGLSYTVDTLRELRIERPDACLFLLLGADSLHDLPQWHQPEEIARLARIAVVERPGSPPIDVRALAPPLTDEQAAAVAEHLVPIPLIEISSTAIRQRAAAGRSIRYLVPPAVEAYIDAHGLYRSPIE